MRRPPNLTAELPGIGGVIKQEPEDFCVDELLERAPSGRGEHLHLRIEKRDISAERMVRMVAGALGIAPNEIGTAGLKDARAVTRQTISVPAACEARVADIDGPSLSVLSAARDDSKLKTGHLLGNRFDLLVRNVVDDAVTRAGAIVTQLSLDGLPNFYGPQRFGDDGVTARIGFDLLRGGRLPADIHPARRGFMRRLGLSAAQSALFNDYLTRRMHDRLLHRAIGGEVIVDRRTDLPMWVTDVAAAQEKIDARKSVPLGPMFGPKMRPVRGEALQREQLVLDTAELDVDAFAPFGKISRGTRRPILVFVEQLQVVSEAHGLRLRFELPAGCYATVLLDELMKVDVVGKRVG